MFSFKIGESSQLASSSAAPSSPSLFPSPAGVSSPTAPLKASDGGSSSLFGGSSSPPPSTAGLPSGLVFSWSSSTATGRPSGGSTTLSASRSPSSPQSAPSGTAGFTFGSGSVSSFSNLSPPSSHPRSVSSFTSPTPSLTRPSPVSSFTPPPPSSSSSSSHFFSSSSATLVPSVSPARASPLLANLTSSPTLPSPVFSFTPPPSLLSSTATTVSDQISSSYVSADTLPKVSHGHPASSSLQKTCEEKERLFKVAIVGDGGVGKTTFCKKHMTGEFDSGYIPTVGVSVVGIPLRTNYGDVRINCLDVAGKDESAGLGDGYLIVADACIIMYDMTRAVTLRHVPDWYKVAVRLCNAMPCVVVGCKSDAPNKVIEESDLNFSLKNNLGFLEVSTKTGSGMDEPFLCLLRQLLAAQDVCLFKYTPASVVSVVSPLPSLNTYNQQNETFEGKAITLVAPPPQTPSRREGLLMEVVSPQDLAALRALPCGGRVSVWDTVVAAFLCDGDVEEASETIRRALRLHRSAIQKGGHLWGA